MVPIQNPGTLTSPARAIRWAFESSRGQAPVDGSAGERGLRLAASCWTARRPESWHYQNVRRALRKVATPIGRASTRGRSVLWRPDERMGLRDRARHK